MKQPIAGVAPSELEEVTVMTVWPSIAAYGPGRMLGRLYAIRWPDVYIFRIGNLLALLSIPLAVLLYFYRLLPSFFGLAIHGGFYKLTNRRVVQLRSEVDLRVGARQGTERDVRMRSLVTTVVALGMGTALVLWALGQLPLWAVLAVVVLALFVLAGIWLQFTFAAETKSVQLDRFDSVVLEFQPGQQWFDAADLVFRLGDTETFRLDGVSRPRAFRYSCEKSHTAYVGVKEALSREAAAV